MIVTSSSLIQDGSIALTNKKVYICFILALVMQAASPMRAADAATAFSAAAEGAAARKTVVVRVDPRTRKLVRKVVMSPNAPSPSVSASTAASAAISDLVEQSARAHNVDPLLVHSIIQVESNYNAYAVSPKGAEGLMQLTPPTARMLGVSDSFDPGENIEAGVKYLKSLQDLFKDDRLALAAYNAGPGAVDKYKWIPPYPETQKYVENVGKRYDAARQAAAVKNAARTDVVKPDASQADPAGVKPQEEKYSTLQQFVDEYGRLHLTTAP
jgi:soluble lytic murein transglycosylase-like protein